MDQEPTKLNARNRLVGEITGLTQEGLVAQVEMHIHDGHIVALITAAAVDELGLAVGKDAVAVIKATSVMIGTADGGVSGA